QDNEVTTTFSSISRDDEVMTVSPLPKFVNDLSDNTLSEKAVRMTRNEGVEGDEVIFETTTSSPIFFASSLTSSSQLSSSSLPTNDKNKIPPKESVADLVRLTSSRKKPTGLFRNKLADKRVQERLSR